MTLDDAKVLLVENDIFFELVEYRNEKEYWHHTMLFPYTKNAKSCKVIATRAVATRSERFRQRLDILILRFILRQVYFRNVSVVIDIFCAVRLICFFHANTFLSGIGYAE